MPQQDDHEYLFLQETQVPLGWDIVAETRDRSEAIRLCIVQRNKARDSAITHSFGWYVIWNVRMPHWPIVDEAITPPKKYH